MVCLILTIRSDWLLTAVYTAATVAHTERENANPARTMAVFPDAKLENAVSNLITKPALSAINSTIAKHLIISSARYSHLFSVATEKET